MVPSPGSQRRSQFPLLFLFTACYGGRWMFITFAFMKGLETLDSINRKCSESQREYEIHRLCVCAFKSPGFKNSLLISGEPVWGAVEHPVPSARHVQPSSLLHGHELYVGAGTLGQSCCLLAWTTVKLLYTTYKYYLLAFLDAVPSL